ncbi:MAG: hypothetical protein HWQ41_01350 [Nostoc sp. NOS(2021)]|uniref:hypothetical protein n=1 Tax=Nostoc sp. NOS(2021) TaxID=2815407 RepID=UPI0025D6EACB|nr:hypothetical protein [Nostoc sp. NOS(2021)]MBN3893980.1 hypothetical protein [Nostoc sp. NOS(2021)]
MSALIMQVKCGTAYSNWAAVHQPEVDSFWDSIPVKSHNKPGKYFFPTPDNGTIFTKAKK